MNLCNYATKKKTLGNCKFNKYGVRGIAPYFDLPGIKQ